MVFKSRIDILESNIRRRGDLLDMLLLDKTTGKNIYWGTNSYKSYGKDFTPKKRIKPDLVTGVYARLIQPRAAKSLAEQKRRTKDNAEVFTPLDVVDQMNMSIDRESKNWPVDQDSWKSYIAELKLEITCGEAPFIAGRYDPTANTGVVITPKNRVGFFDRKLQVVGDFVNSKKEWLEYTELALKATYGYEWQGDNLLIARENILLTIDDFYKDYCKTKLMLKSKQSLTDEQLEHFAEIISWNIWQMDGLKYVVPMSCKHEIITIPGELTLFGETPDRVEKDECEGCKFNRPKKHNGIYSKIMDWENNKIVRFVDLFKN